MSLVTVELKNLPELTQAIKFYQKTTGKTWGDVLAFEAKEWCNTLYDEFKAISPKNGEILAEAEARGYRVNRRAEGLVGHKVSGNVSAAAMKGAQNLMEGRKSDYFSIRDVEGTLIIRRVRFSGRKSHKRLKGGRWGNRFAKSAIHAEGLTTDEMSAELQRDPSVKRLNLSALATTLELSLRARAAKGGTMAVQWLYKVYKRTKNAMLKTGPLINRNKQGIGMGRVDFTNGPDGAPVLITITGEVPGTAQQADKHGIIDKVASKRIYWRYKKAMEALADQKKKAGFAA